MARTVRYAFTATDSGGNARTVNVDIPVDDPVTTGSWPGDPGDGNFYLGWADGPGSNGRGSISYGQSKSQGKLGVYHNYSTATNGRVSGAMIDEAHDAGLIASQSIKFRMAGNEGPGAAAIAAGTYDSEIRADAAVCKARAPHPIILCLYHEPGGDFTTDTMRASYRAATRRMVQIYREEGVTNVTWTCILEAPYDFRPTPLPGGDLGGGRGTDWRKWHPDWKGTNTGTLADWYRGSERTMDLFGLDIYNPLVGGSSFQPYDRIWRDVEYRWNEAGFPIDEYGGCAIFEMGWSDVITPDPDWIAYAQATLVEQASRNIKLFTYWNNNNDSPPRYDMAAAGNASDVDGDKYAGWQLLADAAVTYNP